MKTILASLLAVATIAPAMAQPNVGVSISVNQPGVNGRINIGDVPRPALVLPQPVIIAPPVYHVAERRPIYLYVPPSHQQNWRHYCSQYSACGQPVYFVRDDWVRERYEHDHPGWNNGHHHGDDHDDHGHGKGHDKDKHGH
jgi:hypothetical protein